MTDLTSDLATLLVRFAFGVVILFFLLRFLLGLVRANPGNPLSQSVLVLTNPILLPLRAILPSFGRFDTAAFVIVIGLKVIEIFLLLMILGGEASLSQVIIVALVLLARLIVWIFLISLIIEVVLSWFAASGGPPNPIGRLANDLNRPLLGPIRKIIPNAGMFDFSPMIALLVLYVLLTILSHIA
ncbi:MAG: YggT family protein [Thioalkalivibrionaceae bacterium]